MIIRYYFLTTGNVNQHNKIYLENERAMLEHKGNIIEKEDINSYFAYAVVVPEKMECAAFAVEIETRIINSNLEDTDLYNSDLSVKYTKEHVSTEEANREANREANLIEIYLKG